MNEALGHCEFFALFKPFELGAVAEQKRHCFDGQTAEFGQLFHGVFRQLCNVLHHQFNPNGLVTKRRVTQKHFQVGNEREREGARFFQPHYNQLEDAQGTVVFSVVAQRGCVSCLDAGAETAA